MSGKEYTRIYPLIISKFIDIELSNGMKYQDFYFETAKKVNDKHCIISGKGEAVEIDRIKTIKFSVQ